MVIGLKAFEENFDEIMEAAAHGEVIVICQKGKPALQLTAISENAAE